MKIAQSQSCLRLHNGSHRSLEIIALLVQHFFQRVKGFRRRSQCSLKLGAPAGTVMNS
jgi:hypothetical protein